MEKVWIVYETSGDMSCSYDYTLKVFSTEEKASAFIAEVKNYVKTMCLRQLEYLPDESSWPHLPIFNSNVRSAKHEKYLKERDTYYAARKVAIEKIKEGIPEGYTKYRNTKYTRETIEAYPQTSMWSNEYSLWIDSMEVE